MDKFEKNLDKILKLIDVQVSQLPYDIFKKILMTAIKDLKGDTLFGIFFKFDTIITTLDGDIYTDELAKNLAEFLVQNGFIVIAGDFIYEKKDSGKVERESKTLDSIKQSLEEKYDDHLIKISDILASVTSYAVFLLLNKHSASFQEEVVFHKEDYCCNKGSIAVGFTDDFSQITCNLIVENKTKEGKVYWLCKSNNFKECKPIKENCFFTKILGLSASPIQLHINKNYSKLIVVNKHEDLPKIVLELITK